MMDVSVALVDTNVLLTATTPSRQFHRNARKLFVEWPRVKRRLCTNPQILREYLVVATRPIENNGLELSLEDALANVDVFGRRMRFLDEKGQVFRRLESLLREVPCSGKQVHDANIVASALAHGVSTIITENSGDFRRWRDVVGLFDLSEV